MPPHVPSDPPIRNATLVELGVCMQLLDQALTVQANRGMVALKNSIGRMGTSRVREFLRMNQPDFDGSKVEESK